MSNRNRDWDRDDERGEGRTRNRWGREEEYGRSTNYNQDYDEEYYQNNYQGTYGRGNRGREDYGDMRDRSFQEGRTSAPGSMQRRYNDQDYDSMRRGDYDRDYDYDQDRGYGRGMGNDYDSGRVQTGYGRGMSGGAEGRRYDRDYGMGNYQQGNYGRRGQGYQGGSSYQGSMGGQRTRESWMQEGPHVGKGPQGYQRSDERIREDVHDRLTQHGWVDASNIHVRVENGDVTLEGTVENRDMKRMAEDALDSVPGVKEVHNNLRVQQRQGNWQGQDWSNQSGGQQSGQMSGQQTGQSMSGQMSNQTAAQMGQRTTGSRTGRSSRESSQNNTPDKKQST
jgi:osmotically-inducible protein OsmY